MKKKIGLILVALAFIISNALMVSAENTYCFYNGVHPWDDANDDFACHCWMDFEDEETTEGECNVGLPEI